MKGYIIGLVCLMIVVSCSMALAQAPPPSSNPPGAPIDGLVALLAISGAAYGGYRFKHKKA